MCHEPEHRSFVDLLHDALGVNESFPYTSAAKPRLVLGRAAAAAE